MAQTTVVEVIKPGRLTGSSRETKELIYIKKHCARRRKRDNICLNPQDGSGVFPCNGVEISQDDGRITCGAYIDERTPSA